MFLLSAPVGILFAVQTAHAFPWDIDMYRGAAVQPLSRAPRVMPSGTLPVDRGEPPMSLEESSKLPNPLSATPQNLVHGKDLFLTNCAPCHAESGIGNGPVAHLLKKSPEDLLSAEVRAHPDGYIYGVIRDGHDLMPSYGDAMSSAERWQVVLFLRSLQQAGTPPPKTAQK